MQAEELFATVFVLAMFSGVFIVFLGLRQRSQLLEMRHRERMAMIERGQIPLDDAPSQSGHRLAGRTAVASSRSLSVGIIIVGMGIAIMTVISIAGGSPEVGVGVGGAITVIGSAFIVRSVVVKPAPERSDEV